MATDKKYRSFRCKNTLGLSCRWTIGPTPNGGGFKVLALGGAQMRKQPIPSDFLPFELTREVFNGPVFQTMEECEDYVRRL